ncbi:MAG: AmmeMemoRadiSam system protein A [Chloroflexota bacterium]
MSGGLVYGCVAPHPPILVPAVAGPRVQMVRHTREAMQHVAREIAHLSPDILVVVSPHAPISPRSMSMSVAEQYVGSFEAFGAPSVRISLPGAPALASALENECRASRLPLGRIGRQGGTYHLDHGAAVPLYFLQEAGVRADLLLLAFSGLPVDAHRRFGRAVAAAARGTGKRVVLIASGDFSHRLFPGAPAGFSPRGREFDETLVTALRRQDREAIFGMNEDLLFDAGECGYRSLVIALGALPEAELQVLSYEGPFGVGYLVARFLAEDVAGRRVTATVEPAAPTTVTDEEAGILDLARRAVESYVQEGKKVEPPAAPVGQLGQRAGVFVSLKIGSELRGCIGTFLAAEPTVAAEIVRNAVAAASRDPRFPPVARHELPYLVYSVDILSTPEPIEGIAQLDPRRYGVIVQSGAKRGLLLPDLEGVSTVELQLGIACRKAGIATGTPLQLYRFTVRRIQEKG